MFVPHISHRPKLSFTQEELDYLTRLSRSRNQAAKIVERSKIVLLSYQGKNDTEISKELKVDYKTVRLWIQRVLDFGVKEGLVDKSRSGRPQDISAESRAWIVSLACMKPKDLGYPHEIWTQRLLVKHIRENCIREGHPDLLRRSQRTISKILNASKIKPHKISGSVAKNLNIEAKLYFHRNDYKKADDFSENMQI